MEPANWSIMYGSFCFVSGALALSVGVYLSPHLRNTSARILVLLMAAVSIWSFCYGMEFLRPNLFIKLWWVKAEYFGAVWIGLLLLYFVLTISGYRWHLKPKTVFLFSLIPICTIALAVTNNYHKLIWKLAWLEVGYNTPVLAYQRGAGFWMFVLYSYLLIAAATVILIHSLMSAKGLYKKQLITLLVGISIPWLSNGFYLFGVEIYQYIDLTPASFAITGLAFAWGLLRYQMLSIIPLAHETVIESMEDPVITLDKEDRILDINTAGQTLFKVGHIMPARHELTDLLPGLHDKITFFRRNYPVEIETDLTIRNEKKFWNLRISPLLNKKARQLGWLVILRDITDKRKAENALKESERIHRLILGASPNPIVFYNTRGEVTYLNPAFTRVFGWSFSELKGKKIDFVPPEEGERTFKAIKKTFELPGGNLNFITQRLTKSGEILDVSINAAPNRTDEHKSPGMVVNFTDITQLKAAERELTEAKNYIQSIINSMPSIIIGLDDGGSITHWNSEAKKTTGINTDKAVGSLFGTILPQLSSLMPTVRAALDNHEIKKESRIALNIKDRIMTADITIYPILTHHAKGVVIRIDDISEKVRLEEMMIQSEKMLSVGGLAAGMAHEINNPLAGIIQNIQVIQNRLTRDLPANLKAAEENGIDFEHLKGYLEKRNIIGMMDLVKSSGQRAAQIVSNMLSFSRKSGRRKSAHFLHRIMEDAVKLVESDYSMRKKYDFRNIEIIKEYNTDVPPVLCEENEIQQVFLNILKNGAEAMAEAGIQSPRFILRTFGQNHHVVFDIQDNGPGMDRDRRKRIFEPFFTTKDVGVGTGLGLSVSYFIVTENHGGELSVDSAPGEGTTFRLKIPAKSSRKT